MSGPGVQAAAATAVQTTTKRHVVERAESEVLVTEFICYEYD